MNETEIQKHNKGRKSFDSAHAVNYIDNQIRVELDKKIARNPDVKHIVWPEKNPIIGEVNHRNKAATVS